MQGRLDMEGALTARDRVGIQDFVLLDETTEVAVISNLKKRFTKDLIYTYIGTLLVSVNPYKELDIYSKKQMDVYMGVNFFELPPHMIVVEFAVSCPREEFEQEIPKTEKVSVNEVNSRLPEKDATDIAALDAYGQSRRSSRHCMLPVCASPRSECFPQAA
ncbi:hypothetical protein AMECASPLE_016809 [Ameca splendens]|uniref:Myosin motor domain-containing protein n=1 Tax=Ameca splendens TaxID=208324 RepID=A0ABV0YDJ7_9TELE